MINKIKSKTNLEIKSKGISFEERAILLKTVIRMNAKRRRSNEPRLRYKLKMK